MSWRDEVWPMQWRIGLSGLVNYFAYFLFNPVMFRYHGAVVAGQMGMTMQLVGGVQSLAMVFISTKVPQFGILIARGDRRQLDRLWTRASLMSLAVLTVGGSVLLAGVYGLRTLDLRITERFLEPWPTGMLLAAALLAQVSQCQTAYIRAHRREAIMVLSVTTSVATGILVWLFGRKFGPIGAALSSVGVAAVAVAWETSVWRQFRSDVSPGGRAA